MPICRLPRAWARCARSSSDAIAEQRTGAFSASDWLRRFELRDAAGVLETDMAADTPLVGRASPDFIAALQMPWMRFREPQALSIAASGALDALMISRPRVIGEGKGLWARALLQLRPAAGDPLTELAELRARGAARISSNP